MYCGNGAAALPIRSFYFPSIRTASFFRENATSLPFSRACFTVAEQATATSVASVAVSIRTVLPYTRTPSDSIGLPASTSGLPDRFRPEPLRTTAQVTVPS